MNILYPGAGIWLFVFAFQNAKIAAGLYIHLEKCYNETYEIC